MDFSGGFMKKVTWGLEKVVGFRYLLYLCNRNNINGTRYEKEVFIVCDGTDLGAGLSGNGC